MKTLVLDWPTFGFVVATRAMLGVGIGLLLSERMPAEARRPLALALIGVGVVTTPPALMAVLGGRRDRKADDHLPGGYVFERRR